MRTASCWHSASRSFARSSSRGLSTGTRSSSACPWDASSTCCDPTPRRCRRPSAARSMRSAPGRFGTSARASMSKTSSCSTALEANGFRLMDALVTYTTRPRKEPPHAVREVGTIREFRPEDAPELLAITEDAYRGYKGRFHLDPQLPNDRADAFYVEWAQQCLSGAMADMIFVSTGADGRLLGYLAFRRREPVSTIGGVLVFGGGLGACRTDAPGAYAGPHPHRHGVGARTRRRRRMPDAELQLSRHSRLRSRRRTLRPRRIHPPPLGLLTPRFT